MISRCQCVPFKAKIVHGHGLLVNAEKHHFFVTRTTGRLSEMLRLHNLTKTHPVDPDSLLGVCVCVCDELTH